MRVFLHTKMPGASAWKNRGEEFEQIPRVGDYVAPRHVGGGWFKVTLVVWLPKSAGREANDYAAEIYAVAHPVADARRAADALVTWSAPDLAELGSDEDEEEPS